MPREQGANPGGGLIYAEFQKEYILMEGTINTPQTEIVDVISWYMSKCERERERERERL